MRNRTAYVVALLIVGISERTHSEEAQAPQWSPPGNLVLTTSTSGADPASTMNWMHLIDTLDQSATSDPNSMPGNWLIAPLPFKNELLGAGLVLGIGYLYGDEDRGPESKHSVAGAGGMYAEGGSWGRIRGAAHRREVGKGEWH